MDQILVRPDLEHGQLRGQITFNPHRTRKGDRESPAEIEPRLIATLSDNVKIELDGEPCPIKFEIRELWVPPAATVGDIVNFKCPLPRNARELRVFAGAALAALVVSVEGTDSSGRIGSRSVMVLGGSFSPPYPLQGMPEWREGGANLFMPDGGLTSHEAVAAPSPSASPSAPRAESPHAPPQPNSPSGARVDSSGGGFVEAGPFAQAQRYLVLGYHHILPLGWDHVLFVAGLVLGSGLELRRLVLQLSAFTLAHTVTLALGALGLVVLPASLVEPLIAFSIAYVALENLRQENRERAAVRYRVFVVLAFGLLHGQGFAGALSQTGLPHESFLVALLSFNLGVEFGQLTVVVLLLGALKLLVPPQHLRRYAVVPGSLAIAFFGLYWGVQRLFS
jgi:hypothetical protein